MMKYTFLLFVLVFARFPQPVAAQSGMTIRGDCSESDLDAALAVGGLITFDCGATATFTLTTPKAITANTVLDAGNAKITFLMQHPISVGAATLEVRGIAFEASGSSVGVQVYGGTMILKKTAFRHFTWAGVLGSIGDHSNTILVYDSLFEGNGNPSGDGAAIWSDAYLEVHTSIFRNNHSYDDAAGIHGAAGTYLIEDSLFENNSAGIENDGSGPAIRLGGDITIRRTTFLNNSVVNGGCGAVVAGLHVTTHLTIEDSYFAYNNGYGGGGAICIVEGANASITHSIFVGNQALNGGAIYAGYPGAMNQITLRHNCFMDNVAPNGGDIFNVGATEIDANQNYWGDPGGALPGAIHGAVRTLEAKAACGEINAPAMTPTLVSPGKG